MPHVARDVRAGLAALLYVAALLSPLRFLAVEFGWLGRTDGFMRNYDSVRSSRASLTAGQSECTHQMPRVMAVLVLQAVVG